MQIVSGQTALPSLRPPPVAWLTAPLTPLPYWVAYWVWTAVNFVALAGALVWASRKSGFERWLYAAGALAPWWVVHALNLGQVAPLVAAGGGLSAPRAPGGKGGGAGPGGGPPFPEADHPLPLAVPAPAPGGLPGPRPLWGGG